MWKRTQEPHNPGGLDNMVSGTQSLSDIYTLILRTWHRYPARVRDHRCDSGHGPPMESV